MKKITILALLLVLVSFNLACSRIQQATQNTQNTGPDKIKLMNIVTEEDTQVENNSALATSTASTTEEQMATSTDQEITNKEVIPTEEYLANIYGAVLKTNLGDIEVKFYKQDSPKTVANFARLAEMDFYNGIKFHRVIKDFMIQSGDPNSKDDDWSDDGQGGPGYVFEDEINSHPLVRGSLAMANRGADTNGSQFFIVTAKSTPWLDGAHTNFGEVIKGVDVVMKIQEVEVNENDHPTQDVVIEDIIIVTEEQAATADQYTEEGV